MTKLPDPKDLVDSVADGAVELAEGPVRVAANLKHLSEIHQAMDTIKSRLPDDPSVIADVAVKAVGQTVQAGIGLVEGVGKGITDTLDGIKSQIRRVTG